MRRTIASQRLHFTNFRLIIARFLRYVNRMSAFTTFLSVIFLEFLLVFMVFRYRFIINWCQVVVSHRHRKELLSCPKEANIFTNEKMDVGKHVIKCGISIAGKTLYKSVYAKTYAEVKEKQQKCMVEYRKGAIPERCVTFGSALALWQEVNKSRNKGATNMRYANLIDKHIAPELSNIRISQINTALLSDFMNRKLASGRLDGKGGLSPAYVRSIMLVINSVMEFSIAECLCPPVKINIHMPAMQRKELEILNSSDQARLEAALLADLDETSLGIYLTLQTGLRIGEVCALRWCDVDLARAIIHIRSTIARVRAANNEVCRKTKLIRDTPKTKASTRDIPIAENLLEALRVVKRKCRSEYVISPTAEFVSPRTFEYRFHKFLTENNIPDVNYHVLRHTFATRCVEAGVDIKSLSELLGHSNVSITLNTYVHSSIERKREELKKLNHMV